MSDINWTKTGIYYYVVVAREEYKEEEVLYFQGNYSSKELEELATEYVRENTIMEYEDIEDCYVHIDFIFKSETLLNGSMINNPLPDQVMEEYDNNYLSEQYYEHRTDEAHQIAKEFNLKSELIDDFIEYYLDQCLESDEGYSLVNDESLIEEWWDKNKYIYETKTPFIS